MDIIMDGITFDDFGNTYLSSWEYNAVLRYDSDYTEPPEIVVSGFDGPTSLYYNKKDNILAVPDIGNDRVVLIPMHVTIDADTAWGWAPFDVSFTGGSDLTVDNWTWDFDDGDSAFIQSPSHTFATPGLHSVTLEISGEGKSLKRKQYIVALADTLKAPTVNATADDSMVVVEISATTTIPVDFLQIPIEYAGTLDLTLDSVSRSGCRTEHFDSLKILSSDMINKRGAYRVWNVHPSTSDMEPGSGPVLKVYFTISPTAIVGQSADIVIDGYSSTRMPLMASTFITSRYYSPHTTAGYISTMTCGDVDNSSTVNILDITYIVNYLYKEGPPPVPYEAADVDGSGTLNILDVTYLANYLYKNGPEPEC
jgi:PKD repeat protein